jgi:hypothetical protein
MKKRALTGLLVTGALALAACGDGGSSTETTAPSEGALSGVCPDTVVFQTDWNPEAEHGFLYELIGDDYAVDAAQARVSGTLVDGDVSTGVRVEVRSGGPAIGYQRVTSLLYQDPAIMLGFVSTDEAVDLSGEFPTVAVVAPFNINPQIVMWDPETYPEVKTIADLKATKAKVRYFDGAAYMDYLLQEGILDKAQVDGTYDGLPASFIADGGKAAQQGFGTSEPFYYKNVLEQWKKDVAYQYVHDAGWTAYAQSLGGKPETIESNDACLKLLVPIVQRAQRNYVASPEATNALIVDAVATINNGWAYTAEQAAAAVVKMQEDKLVANGPDGTLGSFDLDRVTAFIEKAVKVYSAIGSTPKQGLTAADLVTNDYIDPSVTLG